MTMLLIGLTEEEKKYFILISFIYILVYGILYFIKIESEDKIEKSNSKTIKKFFEQI